MHFHVIRKHADQEMGPDPGLEAVMDGADLEVGGLQHPEHPFDPAGSGRGRSRARTLKCNCPSLDGIELTQLVQELSPRNHGGDEAKHFAGNGD